MKFKKTDIEIHSDGYGYHGGNPDVNVKVYRVDCDTSDIVEKFGCSEAQAQKALNFAFESACESFWDYWADTTGGNENGLTGSSEYAYFPGERVEVYSEGRSAGWLVVHGLPPVEDWDAIMVSRWAKFQKDVLADVHHRLHKETMLEDIEANEWWKERSSRYNFSETDKGNVCLADVRAEVNEITLEKFGLTLHQVAEG